MYVGISKENLQENLSGSNSVSLNLGHKPVL